MRNRATRLLLAAACIAVAATAWSHMKVGKTSPENGAMLDASPETIRVWYTQEPDVAVSKLTLEGPGGASELELKAPGEKSLSAAVSGLGDGSYTVKWQTAGDDGHIQKGEFSFTIRASE